METRKLGSELEVSALGLGCMGMSAFYGARSDDESLKTLSTALELGVTFWDTSDMYGPHTNEELLGRFFAEEKGRRGQVTLATKFGILVEPDGSRGLNSRPEYVRKACDASLKRLRTDHIDLYYQHRVDPSVPIEDTVGALNELVQAGKVRAIGLSEAGPETIRRAHAVHPVSALQTEYSLWTRDPEAEILPLVRELGITFVAYSPLGRGFLTGAIKSADDLDADDWRRDNPRFQGENFQKNLDLVAKIESLAQARGCTPAQLALAWLLNQGPDIVPIPGTRNPERLKENVSAVGLTLSEQEKAQIDEVLPPGITAGLRYPEAAMSSLNR
jgi:aryl-alcohol dehydrogenase-like predicted oxidoreductase